MGAHRLDRTGWGRASLAALAVLTACTGGGGDDADPTAAPTPTESGRREVARVDAEVEFMPEGVTRVGQPQCAQYARTNTSRGTVHDVVVVLGSAGKPVFAGPAGTTVFYRVKVEAGGQAFDGYVGFQKPRLVEGVWVVDADDLARGGSENLQPETYPGIQEVPEGLTRCAISVRRPDQEAQFVPGTRLLRQGDPVVQDVDGNVHELDDAYE